MINSKKTALVLVNLGSPNELTVDAISQFLKKFLSDKRVVRLPRFIWYPILYGIILTFRSKRLLKQYSKIWLNGCSPLVYYTKQQALNMQAKLHNPDLIVAHAFCYSNPSLSSVLDELTTKINPKKIIILPLYPQYSSTTTAAVFDQVAQFYAKKFDMPNIEFIRNFATHPKYIKAVALSIIQHWEKNGKAQKLLFSYHSLPVSIIKKGDPYYDECIATTKCVVEELGLNEEQYEIAFQSKFGSEKWIEPATIKKVEELAKSGITSLDVVCPGFVCDCLETLEEIAILNKEAFLNNGGQKYSYIECINGADLFTDLSDLT